MNARLFLFVSLFYWSGHHLHAQGQIPDLLQMVLESSHWDRFYCLNDQGQPRLAGIISNNQIPRYSTIMFNGALVEMYTTSPDPQARFFIKIKKCKLNQESGMLKLVYDNRLRVKFKLHKIDESTWRIHSSTFRQNMDCRGKKGSKSFSWNF